jgi:hypothetical protein
MADKQNFLLGKGERLTEPVVGTGRKVDRVPPYTFAQAQERLAPMLQEAVKQFEAIPDAACPNNEAVGSLVLNPEYISKSYYPGNLLRVFNLRAIGSRAVRVTPAQRSRGRKPEEANTTELFVAGLRSSFSEMCKTIPLLNEGRLINEEELGAIETFSAIGEARKIKTKLTGAKDLPLEVVLHASGFQSDKYILEAFQAWVAKLRLRLDIDRRLHAGGLCFIGMMSPAQRSNSSHSFHFYGPSERCQSYVYSTQL